MIFKLTNLFCSSMTILTKLAIFCLRGLCLLYDVVAYIPWMVIDNPRRRLSKWNRVKAKPDSKHEDDESSAYRNVDARDGLSTSMFSKCQTVDDLFTQAAHMCANLPCIGYRELLSEEDEKQPNGRVFKKMILGNYKWLSYAEADARIDNFGRGLLALGQKPRENICIVAETRAEWMIAAQTCFRYNFPLVTLYATLGEEGVAHGVNESQVSIVLTSSELLPKFQAIFKRLKHVKHLICIDETKKLPSFDIMGGIDLHSMKKVEEMGKSSDNGRLIRTKPKVDDLALIMYTSGSTGLPKGVLISHRNIMAGMSGQVQKIPGLGPWDTYIGYLPQAHVLELTAELCCLAYGVRIGYSSPLTLTDQSNKIKRGSKGDVSVLKPTLMAFVPVILDRIFKAVWEKVDGGSPMSKELFQFAYDYKVKKLLKGYDTPLFNKIVFKKICQLLGGNVRMMLCGGAPLSAETQRFINVCFCCPIGQGYGLTETCGAGTIQDYHDLSTGRVGAPLSCNIIKLRNWDEGGYKVTNKPYPQGEILIGGGNVTMGYYLDDEKTKESFWEADGMRWFCTGDVGEFHDDGCLKIIDRKKDLVKLQAGEYVSLGKVETVLKMCNLVDNVCAYADSDKQFTICLAVPNAKQLRALADNLGISSETSWDDLCNDHHVTEAVLKELKAQGNKAKLEKFEIPERVMLCTEAWTPEMGLVTDAFKLKRKNIQKHYEADISRIYA